MNRSWLTDQYSTGQSWFTVGSSLYFEGSDRLKFIDKTVSGSWFSSLTCFFKNLFETIALKILRTSVIRASELGSWEAKSSVISPASILPRNRRILFSVYFVTKNNNIWFIKNFWFKDINWMCFEIKNLALIIWDPLPPKISFIWNKYLGNCIYLRAFLTIIRYWIEPFTFLNSAKLFQTSVASKGRIFVFALLIKSGFEKLSTRSWICFRLKKSAPPIT